MICECCDEYCFQKRLSNGCSCFVNNLELVHHVLLSQRRKAKYQKANTLFFEMCTIEFWKEI